MTTPILAYSNFKQTFIVATNTLYNRYRVTLSQIGLDNKEHLIVYTSKSLWSEEVNYEAIELKYTVIV